MTRTIMMNKPGGFLSARSDRVLPTVMDLLPPELQDLHLVGRLDFDTEGMLLLTDDGMLDRAVLLPERGVEKVYFFRAFGRLDEAAFEKMRGGVQLGSPDNVSLPARAWLQGYTTIGACEEQLPAKEREHLMKNAGRPVTEGFLAIREGRKHEVKLIVKAAGGHVFYLKRLSIGGLRLDPDLSPGQWRALTEEEIELLKTPGNG